MVSVLDSDLSPDKGHCEQYFSPLKRITGCSDELLEQTDGVTSYTL